MTISFTAFKRDVTGKGASRRLRHAGKTPGIVYGSGQTAEQIELDHNALYHALRKEEFHSTLLTMNLDGKAEAVVLRDVQMHPYKQLVLHVDFQRVNANEEMTTKVAIHFINGDISPAVKLGGIISHVVNELEIAALPAKLPAFIEVDLASLEAGQSIHAADLKLPEGVRFVAHGGDKNPVIAATATTRKATESAEEA